MEPISAPVASEPVTPKLVARIMPSAGTLPALLPSGPPAAHAVTPRCVTPSVPPPAAEPAPAMEPAAVGSAPVMEPAAVEPAPAMEPAALQPAALSAPYRAMATRGTADLWRQECRLGNINGSGIW
eukprot:Skav225592  [mRNA]  locus=scaffold1527:48908:49823:- [translate_table: standard]